MEQSLCDTEDLSLFSGDILNVLDQDWSVASEQQFLSQDGLKEKTTAHIPEGDYTDLLSLGQSFYDPVESWLDTKVDLLDLFNDNLGEFLGLNLAQQSLSLLPADPGVSAPVNNYDLPGEMPDSPVMEELAHPGVEFANHSGVADPTDGQILHGSKELLALLTEQMEGMKDEPILPPMSPEDIESILSSEPCSPSQSDSSLSPQFSPTTEKAVEQIHSPPGPVKQIHSSPGPVKTILSPSKHSAPYSVNHSKSKTVERKARKRQQNRDAALRYRLKKRAESSEIVDECDELERKNKDLKDNVDQMTREIQYLKDLMAEVFKARKKKKVPTATLR